ncbi:MAG: DUF362 domain-containing protein [Prevotellaceae bacterium]|nr:DUF362 domain-containing protein [Prevotellaceae bacterium]
MRKIFATVILALSVMLGANAQQTAKVYFTKEITPESLVKIYEALGVKEHGRVGVKISTGESGGNNYLKPTLIRGLVDKVNGTILECCTAYGGSRQDKAKHWATIHEHGFDSLFAVDLLDEYGDLRIPVKDKKWIKYDIVGEHLGNYDFCINLAHFKGHQMGGFGGVLKNQSIGFASTAGKAYIHSHGVTAEAKECWKYTQPQDAFLESMASAAQGVADWFGEGNIVYINVLNNISIDCDCDAHPHAPEIQDIGIVASTDPVACDRAAYDLIYNVKKDEKNNPDPLRARIEKQHGIHIVEWAEKIGLGTSKYKLVSLDK